MEETTPQETVPVAPVDMNATDVSVESHTVVIPPRGGVRVESGVYDGNKVTDSTVALVVALALTGLVVVSALTTWDDVGHTVTREQTQPVATVAQAILPSGNRPFDALNIQAQAVAIYDVQADKFLYVENAEQVRPLASLTKLMTGLLAYESASAEASVTIKQYAIETEGDSGLLVNETWRLGDLLSFTLVSSSNDGADAIATAVGSLWDLDPNTTDDYVSVERFVDTMNRRAGEIGLMSTSFKNPSGLDDTAGSYGGTGTAQDVAHLLAYMWEHAPETLIDTTKTERSYVSEDGFIHTATNTNGYVGTIPGLLGSKTGYTDRAGGNLAVIYDAGLNHPIVLVVMGSSVEGRFSDVHALMKATNAYMTEGWYAYEIAGSTPTL